MSERKNVWDLWRIIAVVSLSVAGVSFAFLTWWADTLLPTVVLGFAAFFFLFSAAYEVATGEFLARFEKGFENGSGEVESADESSPSPQDILRKEFLIVGRGLKKLEKRATSFLRHLKSLFTKLGSIKEGPSTRQKEIWYEDVLDQSISQVKKSLRKRNLDLEAVLEAERKGRNRKELVRWLEDLVSRNRRRQSGTLVMEKLVQWLEELVGGDGGGQ